MPLMANEVGNTATSGGMLIRLAGLTVRRPKLVLVLVAVLLGISIVFGTGVTDKLAVGGYNAPNSESTHAGDFLDQNFGTTSNLVIQVLPNEGTIDSPEATKVADQVTSVIEARRRRRSTGRSPTKPPPTCVAATVAPG